ncbi:translation initiation factor eIF-2B subunit epsilon [Achlya hypogyna]|uniref:Translation initiation factor eIF2B subunit epsilon n=1 Tax=Achlya hypogyna TaxID=1202772 RepID=A0A1V9Z1Q7_ACHHY|nr:translation initiation factor eIF-2B subunit epsilon [Achlya hypogyna]
MPPKKAAEEKDEKHKHPLQAVLFADSWTKTFRPVSLETPKVLLPLANVPMLEYTLEFLASNGVEEVLIFCTAHAQAIEAFLASSVIARTVKTQCILAPTCLTAGDAIRELDRMQLVRSDPFILISGDVVSNMNLKAAIESHEARKKKDSTSIMTVVMKEVQVHHDIRPLTDDLLVAMDTQTNQIVLYETSHSPSAFLPTVMFQDHRQIGFRYDLMDAQVDICSPDVLVQFSDNFDYQDIRRDFIRNEVLNYEMGNRIHAHIISKEFAARVHDPRTYSAISHAILQRWVYPMVPDNNFLGPASSYHHQRGDIYKEAGVSLARTATVHPMTIIGDHTTIEAGSAISKSAIGRHCRIGKNVRITGSFLWDNVTIEDDVVLDGAIICNNAVVRKGAKVQEGSIVSFNVVVGAGFTVPSYTKLTTVRGSGDDDGFSDDDDDDTDDGSWNPQHVGPDGEGRIWTLDDDEIFLEGSDDEDDDGDNEHARMHRLKQTLIGAKELVSARTTRLASWDALSESDDEEPLNAFEEEDPMERFVRVVMDMVQSGDANGDDVENLFLEIKSFKFAQNRSFADCLEAILPALCNAIPRANKAPMAIMGLLKPKFEKWRGVVSKCIMNDVERVKIVNTFAAYCVHPNNAPSFGTLLRFILQVAYDLEWVTEETIFTWEDKVLAAEPRTIAFAADFTEDELRVMELPSDVCDALEAGEQVYVVGDATQRAVLCTATKSYHLVREDQSNMRLLVDSVNWEADKTADTISVRGSAMSHYELVPKPLDMNQLKQLLLENPWTGAAATAPKRQKLSLYALDDLIDRLQHSPHEVSSMLAQLKAFEIDGFWRLLDSAYQRNVVGQILDVVVQNDWDFNAAHTFEAFAAHLPDVHPTVLSHCLRLYSAEDSSFQLDAAKIAKFQAVSIFEEAQGKEWALNAFMEQWGFRVPMGVAIDPSLLLGIAIRRANDKLVYFPESQLSIEPKQRFAEMFAFQPKWLLAQLAPSLLTEGMTQASLLLKYTRASRVANSPDKLYSKR